MSERRLFLRSIKSRRERYEVRGDAGTAFDFDTISEGGANFSPGGFQIERFPISVNNYVNHAGFTSKKP